MMQSSESKPVSEEEVVTIEGAVCPVPLAHKDRIIIGHGSGGKLSHDLITRLFLPAFKNPILMAGDDGGVMQLATGERLAVSTDCHVVTPLFFPGGDIGRLAICGTVNDVAMMGATPLYLTAGFILEEGLDVEILQKVVASMQKAAEEAGIQVISGDTKVVQRGKADGLYITTAGIGTIPAGLNIGGAQAKPGDAVLVSGSMGDHGISVLAARGDLGFSTDIQSDVAPLNHLIHSMLETANTIHVLRDPTRGGLATTLNEIARQSNLGIQIYEKDIPVKPAVAAACEMLGMDPLYIANEGKVICILPKQDAQTVLETMRSDPYGKDAMLIGEVTQDHPRRVLVKTEIGSTRIADMLSGEILPRIC